MAKVAMTSHYARNRKKTKVFNELCRLQDSNLYANCHNATHTQSHIR